MLVLVLVRLAGLVMMALRAILHFGAHRGRRDARPVLEHELTAELADAYDDRESEQRDRAQDPLLRARHVEAPPQLPDEQGGEDAHRHDRPGLMRLHELVDRLAVLD